MKLPRLVPPGGDGGSSRGGGGKRRYGSRHQSFGFSPSRKKQRIFPMLISRRINIEKIRHVCKMGSTAPDEDVATRTCDMD